MEAESPSLNVLGRAAWPVAAGEVEVLDDLVQAVVQAYADGRLAVQQRQVHPGGGLGGEGELGQLLGLETPVAVVGVARAADDEVVRAPAGPVGLRLVAVREGAPLVQGDPRVPLGHAGLLLVPALVVAGVAQCPARAAHLGRRRAVDQAEGDTVADAPGVRGTTVGGEVEIDRDAVRAGEVLVEQDRARLERPGRYEPKPAVAGQRGAAVFPPAGGEGAAGEVGLDGEFQCPARILPSVARAGVPGERLPDADGPPTRRDGVSPLRGSGDASASPGSAEERPGALRSRPSAAEKLPAQLQKAGPDVPGRHTAHHPPVDRRPRARSRRMPPGGGRRAPGRAERPPGSGRCGGHARMPPRGLPPYRRRCPAGRRRRRGSPVNPVLARGHQVRPGPLLRHAGPRHGHHVFMGRWPAHRTVEPARHDRPPGGDRLRHR